MIENTPVLLVFAGPNGSGKSTVTRRRAIVGEYVNADEIKRALKCDDLSAAQAAERTREWLLAQRMSFTFETVLSTGRNVDLIRRAKQAGYYVEVIYVVTKDSAINVQRVQDRVLAGGHDVPREKIVSRYEKSMSNIRKVAPYCDVMHVFDNSGEAPVLICSVLNGTVSYVQNKVWGKRLVKNLFCES